MKLFLDTNILMDVTQGREPFFEDSSKIVQFAHREGVQAFISWHSMATLFYILSKPWGDAKTKAYLSDVLAWADLTSTSKFHALEALAMNGKDFEDDLQSQCGLAAECDFIITRNTKDFTESEIEAITPADFLALHNSSEDSSE